MVSGAGVVSQCFKRRILTRVFQVGAGKACTPILPPVRGSGRGVVSARQLKRRVRAYGWCRAQMHTRKERRDENSSQMRSRAGGVQSFQVWSRLPPRHSFRSRSGHRFQGLEYRSCSLIRPGWTFPDSAPSLLLLTGKGLMPLSSLSFSRSAFSADPRRVSPSGWSVLRPPGSRRQRTLHEPHEHCTRLAIMALVLCPAGGFGSFLPHPH